MLVASITLPVRNTTGRLTPCSAQLSQSTLYRASLAGPNRARQVGIDRTGKRAKQRRAIGESVNEKPWHSSSKVRTSR